MDTVSSLSEINQFHGVDKLLQVVARLRHPERGCPWDLKQTHQSLRPYLLEEAYEAVEAIDESAASGDAGVLKEELGDVLLQVALHSQLASEAGTFDFAGVCEAIAEKLIRRHPHVFGDVAVDGAEAVVANWEAIKQAEKAQKNGAALISPAAESLLKGVAKGQPALSRALDTSQRAVKVGFEWPSLESLWECVMSEYDEFREEVQAVAAADGISPTAFERLEAEMGDILFASVNLARHFKIDPEIALTRATAKFTRRFQAMERLIEAELLPQAAPTAKLDTVMKALDFETWDKLWRRAKALT